MRSRTACLAIALLLCPTVANADGLFIESGPGISHSLGSTAVFVRYQRDASALFGLESFYEVSYGSWNGPNRDEPIALARGVLWPSEENSYFSFELGLSHVRTTTKNLDTPFEFMLRGAYGRTIGRLDISLGFVHYSNGKFIFRYLYPRLWETGHNFGEYFPTLQLGITF